MEITITRNERRVTAELSTPWLMTLKASIELQGLDHDQAREYLSNVGFAGDDTLAVLSLIEDLDKTLMGLEFDWSDWIACSGRGRVSTYRFGHRDGKFYYRLHSWDGRCGEYKYCDTLAEMVSGVASAARRDKRDIWYQVDKIYQKAGVSKDTGKLEEE